MADVNIKSENQSGGITAQNVNAGNGNHLSANHQTEKEGPAKAIFWWIFGVLGALSAIVAIVKYFHAQ